MLAIGSLLSHRAAAGVLAASPPLSSFAVAQGKGEPLVSRAAALHRRLDGNARYQANAEINVDRTMGRHQRALGQKPFAAIVSCAEPWVAPELIFDQGPGRSVRGQNCR